MSDLEFTNNPQIGESVNTYKQRIAAFLHADGTKGMYTPSSGDLSFSNDPQTTDSTDTMWGRIAVAIIS